MNIQNKDLGKVQLLCDQNIIPNEEILIDILHQDNYQIYKELMNIADAKEIAFKWVYYVDKKAWFCKFIFKRKVVFQFSVWSDYLRIIFSFKEKFAINLDMLNISDRLKKRINKKDLNKELNSLIFEIDDPKLLKDIEKLIELKKSL